MIKAVLFDLEGTLALMSLNDAQVVHAVLNEKGIDISLEEVENALLTVIREEGSTLEKKCGRIPRLEYHTSWNVCILKALKIEEKDRSISREISNRWIDICGLSTCPDAGFVLTRLKNKVKIGILSGVYEEEIQRILEIVKLEEELFDVIVGADTIRKTKPDPEVFFYALRKLGVSPEEAIYVGDDLERDYRPAERIGMFPLLFLPERGEVPNTRVIKNLMSVLDYL